MKFSRQIHNRQGLRHAAFTIVELVIGSAIGILALGGVGMMLLQVGVEMKGGIASASVQQEAARLQDTLVNMLRPMSATESTTFGNSIAGSPSLFRKVIIARGPTFSGFPREEIYFNSTNLSLIHDPNRAVNGDEETVYQGNKLIALRNVYFFPSMKPGGIPDDTTLNVGFEMDDARYVTPKNGTGGAYRTNTVKRYFTVRMRAI